MPSLPVVEALDVGKDIGTSLVASQVRLPANPIFLRAREKRFRDGIVVAVPPAAHASLVAM
jgi:hypothetical protein